MQGTEGFEVDFERYFGWDRVFHHVIILKDVLGNLKAYLAEGLLWGDLVTDTGEDLSHVVCRSRIPILRVIDVLEDHLERLRQRASGLGEDHGCGGLNGFGHRVLHHVIILKD